MASEARAATYSEAVNGDLSGDRLAPTVIGLDVGANSISATSIAGDREYFRFTVPPGARIDAVNVSAYSAGTNLAFIAVQRGIVFTEPPTGTAVGQLLGWTHFGPGNGTVGTDILDNLGTGAGAIGFTGPLSSGDYVFWAQETSTTSPSTYTLTFIVAAAPVSLPALGAAGAALLAVALAGVAMGVGRLRTRS